VAGGVQLLSTVLHCINLHRLYKSNISLWVKPWGKSAKYWPSRRTGCIGGRTQYLVSAAACHGGRHWSTTVSDRLRPSQTVSDDLTGGLSL
jgi:hypothetical protein